MKVIIAITEIEAEEPLMHFGYKAAMLDSRFGTNDGNGNIIMDATRLNQIRSAYQPKPGVKPMTTAQVIAALTPKSGLFGTRLRTPEEKALLRPICAACDKFKDGNCLSAKCCGGKLPVEVIYNLTTTDCPLHKFPKP